MADKDQPKADDRVTTQKAPPAPRKAAPRATAGQEPAELAAEIERTREELASTLDAIADKVSPKRVAKRTTKKVTTSVRETAVSAKDAVTDAVTHAAAGARDAVSGSHDDELPAADLIEARDADDTVSLEAVPLEPLETVSTPGTTDPTEVSSITDRATHAKDAIVERAREAVAPTGGTLSQPAAGLSARRTEIAVGAAVAVVGLYLLRRRSKG